MNKPLVISKTQTIAKYFLKQMKKTRIITLALTSFLIFTFTIKAQPFEEALLKKDVKKWFITMINAHELQLKYKSEADKYDDVIVAYYEERNLWVESLGYEPKEFDKLSERINAGYGSMKDQKSLDEERAGVESQINEIENLPMVSDNQKNMMKNGILAGIKEQQKVIDYFKPDWPALEPYIEEFNLLDLWIGGNITNHPTIN
tara:strand:- start:56398 stop:57006 length:609 start_codon:yes stop_codon:yes gene_type:complete